MTRLERLRAKLPETGADAWLVSQPENRRYLSGFTGSAGYLIISPERAVLATDFRYTQQAKGEAPFFEVVEVRGEPPAWLPGLLKGMGVGRLAFEALYLSFSLGVQLRAALLRRVKLVPTEGIVEELRAVKEPGELELISRAIALTDRALEHALELARPGVTEAWLAWQIEKFLRENGSGSPPFDLIVAAGANGALAHHHPDDTPLPKGQPIVIDIGARVDGYGSDLTRTICLGRPDDRFRSLYSLVLSAQEQARQGIRPGMTGEEADRLAREVISGAGYGEAFGHGLGHGVGLATHEEPRLGTGSRHGIEKGMVFTLEPGVYIPGWGGIRIEDVALLEKDGAHFLSQAPK